MFILLSWSSSIRFRNCIDLHSGVTILFCMRFFIFLRRCYLLCVVVSVVGRRCVCIFKRKWVWRLKHAPTVNKYMWECKRDRTYNRLKNWTSENEIEKKTTQRIFHCGISYFIWLFNFILHHSIFFIYSIQRRQFYQLQELIHTLFVSVCFAFSNSMANICEGQPLHHQLLYFKHIVHTNRLNVNNILSNCLCEITFF